LSNLGVLYKNLGDCDKAEPLSKRALEISEKALGPDHPVVAMRLFDLATLYDVHGEYVKVEPLYNRALKILEAELGPEHPSTVTVQESFSTFSQRHGFRTWTDITGKYTREAHFVSFSDGVVELHLANGEGGSIPFDQLSKADQWYVVKAQLPSVSGEKLELRTADLEEKESVSTIDKNLASELVRHEKNRLDLSGLTSIDKDVAKELAKFQGKDVCLNGLASIDIEVAKELAKFQEIFTALVACVPSTNPWRRNWRSFRLGCTFLA